MTSLNVELVVFAQSYLQHHPMSLIGAQPLWL